VADPVLLENTLSKAGLRELHIMWMGTPEDANAVAMDEWLSKVSPDADDCQFYKRYKKDLGMWHLHIYWSARELVTLVDGKDLKPAVMWKLGQRISWSIDLAATCYRLGTGEWPQLARIRALPAGAKTECEVKDGSGHALVKLAAAEWVPKGFIVVM